MTQRMSKTKFIFMALALTASSAWPAPQGFGSKSSFQQRSLDNARVQRNMEYNQLKNMLIETQAMLDALQMQLKQAPAGQDEALFKSASEEYGLPSFAVKSLREAMGYSQRYLAMENEALALEIAAKNEKPSLETKRKIDSLYLSAKALRVKGQKAMKKTHKELKGEEMQSLRNWITVSEGILMRQQEQAQLAAAQAVSPVAAAPAAPSASSQAISAPASATSKP